MITNSRHHFHYHLIHLNHYFIFQSFHAKGLCWSPWEFVSFFQQKLIFPSIIYLLLSTHLLILMIIVILIFFRQVLIILYFIISNVTYSYKECLLTLIYVLFIFYLNLLLLQWWIIYFIPSALIDSYDIQEEEQEF